MNYADIYARIEQIMLGAHHNLLESLASDIAKAVLADEQVQRVRVRLEKSAAPLAEGVNLPAVLEIERESADYGL